MHDHTLAAKSFKIPLKFEDKRIVIGKDNRYFVKMPEMKTL